MIDKNIIGTELGNFIYTIERSKILEFCAALANNNQLFHSKEEAVRQGYDDTPAPLTIATLIDFWGGGFILGKIHEYGIDITKFFHISEEYEYFHPVYHNDRIDCTMKVDSIHFSSLVDYAIFSREYKKQHSLILRKKSTLILPKEINNDVASVKVNLKKNPVLSANFPEITALQLIKYAGASGDFNPRHVVFEYDEQKKKYNIPIAHGMFVMGLVSTMITDNFDLKQIRKFAVNFKSITNIGDRLTAKIFVDKEETVHEGRMRKYQVVVEDQYLNVKLSGMFEAVLK